MTTRRSRCSRLAAATVLALALVGCGDDGGDEETSVGTEGPAGTTAPIETSEAATDDGPPDLCDLLASDVVATAGGVEVVGTQPATGTGSLDGIDYATEGCTYELADGGSVDVRALTDPDGAPFGPDGFAELRAASDARRGSDDFPHEDVSDLGAGAFFVASLLGNELVVDTGTAVLTLDGEVADEPLSRDALRAVAAEAVTAVG